MKKIKFLKLKTKIINYSINLDLKYIFYIKNNINISEFFYLL